MPLRLHLKQFCVHRNEFRLHFGKLMTDHSGIHYVTRSKGAIMSCSVNLIASNCTAG